MYGEAEGEYILVLVYNVLVFVPTGDSLDVSMGTLNSDTKNS